MNLLIAESGQFSKQARSLLAQVAEVEAADLDRAGLLDRLEEVDVLWVRLRNRIDREMLDAAPRLKILASPTTGLNHIDLEEAERRGITVCSLRGETGFLETICATAECTLALALALLRNLPEASTHVREGGWNRDAFKGRELRNKTVGLWGFGRLGRLAAGYFLAFGCRVLASDPEPGDPVPGVAMVSRDDLLREADLVSLHMNVTQDTEAICDRACFQAMRPGTWFVNTARGELVDEAALLDALQSGHLAGAALDVLAREQHLDEAARRRHPLIRYAAEHDNLLITPHIGGCTRESMEQTELFLADKIVSLIRTLT